MTSPLAFFLMALLFTWALFGQCRDFRKLNEDLATKLLAGGRVIATFFVIILFVGRIWPELNRDGGPYVFFLMSLCFGGIFVFSAGLLLRLWNRFVAHKAYAEAINQKP